MTDYYRIMLGKKSSFVDECVAGGFIGADFDIREDLTSKLPENWRDFNQKYIPIFMKNVPDKTKVAAGLACGMLWTICRGINEGDFILSPTGTGMYHVGQVTGGYQYVEGSNLPHRRPVTWRNELISRQDMSEELKRSSGSVGTVSNVSKYAGEISSLLAGPAIPALTASDPNVEDASTFALEKHLEDFLVGNWNSTTLGKSHVIFEIDGEKVGQQYPTDTGPIDILAVSRDSKELLVVELKRGRASDAVVGQVQRYMGYVQEVLAEPGQRVRGVIIALEDDLRIRRALAVAPNIDFYRYQVSFKLDKA
jgi:restriction system protein